jgi:RNA polymerase sigma-70 factor (ECF subfamily)
MRRRRGAIDGGYIMNAVPLPRQRATAGFYARTTLDESAASARMVSLAVARGKAGDRDAIRYLYVRYSHNIYGYVRSIVRDDHDAEDVTQHVFAKLITALAKYDERGVPFFAWLLRLAHNVAIDHLRGRRATPAEEVFGADARADEEGMDRSHSLRDALQALPDEQRSVVVLRHVVGLTPGEIASAMGRTESSIHGLHHRGRRALQLELANHDSAPSTAALAVAA